MQKTKLIQTIQQSQVNQDEKTALLEMVSHFSDPVTIDQVNEFKDYLDELDNIDKLAINAYQQISNILEDVDEREVTSKEILTETSAKIISDALELSKPSTSSGE